jgi:hypothetical protein
VDQVVQIVGALLILVAFAGVQFGRLDPGTRAYLWPNFVGSVILAVLALTGQQWGFVLLETVWAAVSAWGLLQLARGRAPTGAH